MAPSIEIADPCLERGTGLYQNGLAVVFACFGAILRLPRCGNIHKRDNAAQFLALDFRFDAFS
jgi:hypothetical protein